MSKMSELSLCVGELRSAAQSLNAVADSLTALFSGTGEAEPSAPVVVNTTFTQTSNGNVQIPEMPQKPKPLTLEQVRAVLAEKSRSGHTAEVRALLEAHGVAKLSEIDPAEYPVLLAEASRIGLAEGDANG
jgi:hypothetical protein